MLVLLSVIRMLESMNQLAATLVASMTPAQAEKFWNRYFELTEWAHKLLVKFNDRIVDLIEREVPKPVPPKSLAAKPEGRRLRR